MRKLIFIILIFASQNTFSGDGKSLLDSCGQARILWNGGSADKAQGMYCIGMTNGLVASLVINENSYTGTGKSGGICDENNSGKFIPTGEAIRVIHNFLENNPDRLKELDVILAMHALIEHYQCPTNK